MPRRLTHLFHVPMHDLVAEISLLAIVPHSFTAALDDTVYGRQMGFFWENILISLGYFAMRF
jgi:hypothetical protein